MKPIILCLCLFIFIRTEAQQINPVPDYVFSNKMSVGRNAVTDTAAYFSIGPRYGAIRGMMPPMVTDTANMSATKRNGLLIFSIQKNKYLYWDSVGSKWAEMAGTAGSAITGSGVAGYMPEFTTSTNLDTTRLYHSAGRFAIGSTTTTSGVFNVYGGQAYFDTSLKVGTQTLLADEGKNEVYVNTTSDAGAYALQVAGAIYNTTGAVLAASSGNVGIGTTSAAAKLEVRQNMTTALAISHIGSSSTALPSLSGDFGSLAFQNTNTTNNNYNSILWLNDESTISASIHGVYTSHSAGAQSGALIFGTRNAGTYAERFRMTSDGHLIQGTVIGPSAWSVGGGNNRAYQNGIANLYFDAGGNNAMEMTLASYYDGTNWKYQASSVGSGRYQITGANAGATHRWYVSAGGTTDNNISYTEAMRINASSELLLNTTIDAGAYALQVSGAIYNTTTITTGAPTSGSAKPWRLGEAATVSPTSPNRTIRVEIDGTVYYLHAKTTND